MVAVVLAAFDEGGAVGPVELAVEHLDRVAVAPGAVALDIERMAHQPAGAALAAGDLGMDDHARFDDDALLQRAPGLRELHARPRRVLRLNQALRARLPAPLTDDAGKSDGALRAMLGRVRATNPA